MVVVIKSSKCLQENFHALVFTCDWSKNIIYNIYNILILKYLECLEQEHENQSQPMLPTLWADEAIFL